MTELVANFILSEGEQFDTQFVISASPEKVSQLENDLNFQTKTQVQEAIQSESEVINARIDSEVADLEQQIHDATLDIQGSDLIGVDKQEQTVTITSKTYIFEQGIASNEWVINHNLNKRPSIELVDSQGREFKAFIEYNSDNQCTVILDSATTGYAYLN